MFKNLQVLNLSNNFIRRIQNLPPNIQELNLTGNLVDEIEPMRPITSLIHLGLSYNRLTADALPSIAQSFPKLFCLNLSFNQICDMK